MNKEGILIYYNMDTRLYKGVYIQNCNNGDFITILNKYFVNDNYKMLFDNGDIDNIIEVNNKIKIKLLNNSNYVKVDSNLDVVIENKSKNKQISYLFYFDSGNTWGQLFR